MATHPVCRPGPIALIVEDDPNVREFAAVLLEQTDLRVIECEDSEEAFAVLCREGGDVALVFADIHLPGLLDGIDLVKRVKVLWPKITMIVTSANPGSRLESLPDSVLYMPKPWLPLAVLMQANSAAARMRESHVAAA